MSGKLDKSLDEILSTSRTRGGARRRSQRRTSGRPTPAAPVGGIQKTAKPIRAAAAKAAPSKAGARATDSKVIVSNLPKDVSEQQIKEYFLQSVGPIKKVELSYGPNSVSRGIANIIFRDPEGASKAFDKLNGLLVDNRPIKIEIVVSDAQAVNLIPPAKTLAERTSQPKAQPKSAAADKHAANAAKQTAARTRGKKSRARNSRPTKKTAEELDSDMMDYFGSGNNENNTATTAAPAGGDAPMEDEIM